MVFGCLLMFLGGPLPFRLLSILFVSFYDNPFFKIFFRMMSSLTQRMFIRLSAGENGDVDLALSKWASLQIRRTKRDMDGLVEKWKGEVDVFLQDGNFGWEVFAV